MGQETFTVNMHKHQSRYGTWLSGGAHRRWLVVAGGILVNMALGVRHSWSVFGSPLVAEYRWDALTVTWPLVLSTIVFALLMIPAGRWNDRYGPMPVGVAGGVLMGIGFISSSFAPRGLANAGAAWTWIMLTIGVVTGVAMALGYAVPLATAVKWFPDRRGLVSGLAVFGFGFSAVVFGPLANTMILQGDVLGTFLQLGIVFCVMIVVGSLLLTTPPARWRPAGCPPISAGTTLTGLEEKRDFSPRELLQTKETYMLILMYAFSTAAGLMVISFAKNFLDSFKFNDLAVTQGLGWINAIPVIGFNIFTRTPAELSAVLVAWLALWNALGRIMVGCVYDRIGRRRTMALNFVTTAMSVALMPLVAESAWLMLLMYSLVGLTFGGTLTLFPSTNADWFGTTHVGVNYGIIFLGWGLGGVIGPLVGNFGVGALGGYQTGFVIAAVLGLIATLMAFTIRRPVAHVEAIMSSNRMTFAPARTDKPV